MSVKTCFNTINDFLSKSIILLAQSVHEAFSIIVTTNILFTRCVPPQTFSKCVSVCIYTVSVTIRLFCSRSMVPVCVCCYRIWMLPNPCTRLSFVTNRAAKILPTIYGVSSIVCNSQWQNWARKAYENKDIKQRQKWRIIQLLIQLAIPFQIT